MKTIDIQAKEWFDRINGNSYFSARYTIDFGRKTEQTFYLPFEYGYGDFYLQAVKDDLIKRAKIRIQKDEKLAALWSICKRRKITLRHNIQDKCKKRDVLSFGIQD